RFVTGPRSKLRKSLALRRKLMAIRLWSTSSMHTDGVFPYMRRNAYSEMNLLGGTVMTTKNNREKTRKPQPRKGAPVTHAEFEEWIAECERLAIGAREILDSVVRVILSEGKLEEVRAESRLSDLIYPEGQKGRTYEQD